MTATDDRDFAANSELLPILVDKLLVDTLVIPSDRALFVGRCHSQLSFVDLTTFGLFEQLLFC